MSYVSVMHCSFMRKGVPSDDYRSLDQTGLFRVPSYDPWTQEMLGCIRYDSRAEWDRNFKLARANAVFLLVSSSSVVVLYTLSVLFLWHERQKLIIHWICRCLIIPSVLFNSLLFVVFGGEDCRGEDVKCPPGPGAILAVFNGVVLFAMAILCLLVSPPAHPCFVPYASVFPEGVPDPSVFSVPEIVRARRAIRRERSPHAAPYNKSKAPPVRRKKTRNARVDNDDSIQSDVTQCDPNSLHARDENRRDGSSSSTLVTGDFLDDDVGQNNNNYAQKYCAPTRSSVRQCV